MADSQQPPRKKRRLDDDDDDSPSQQSESELLQSNIVNRMNPIDDMKEFVDRGLYARQSLQRSPQQIDVALHHCQANSESSVILTYSTKKGISLLNMEGTSSDCQATKIETGDFIKLPLLNIQEMQIRPKIYPKGLKSDPTGAVVLGLILENKPAHVHRCRHQFLTADEKQENGNNDQKQQEKQLCETVAITLKFKRDNEPFEIPLQRLLDEPEVKEPCTAITSASIKNAGVMELRARLRTKRVRCEHLQHTDVKRFIKMSELGSIKLYGRVIDVAVCERPGSIDPIAPENAEKYAEEPFVRVDASSLAALSHVWDSLFLANGTMFTMKMPIEQVRCYVWYAALRVFHPDSDAPLFLHLSRYCGDSQMYEQAKALCYWSLDVNKSQLIERICTLFNRDSVLSDEGVKPIAKWLKENLSKLDGALARKLRSWAVVYNAMSM